MPPLLAAADSFNSSSSTIVPDRKDGQRQANNAIGSFTASGRGLMPNDSLGRIMNELLSSDGISDLSPQHPPGQNLAHVQGGFDPHQLSTLPETDPLGMSSLLDSIPQSNMFDPTPQPYMPMNETVFRPSSAHSNHSHHSARSVSGSEYSYTTTEMDEDDIREFLPEVDNNVQWGFNHQTTGQTSYQGTVAPASVSPPPIGMSPGLTGPSNDHDSRIGPRRNARRDGGSLTRDEAERLEKRRLINRKSAEKHRRIRKEEVVNLKHKISEKDALIAELQKQLAVEKAKVDQLQQIHTIGRSRG
ncbi:hypothetical protein M231_02003 [Tremella mesenterica]|uniref:BZIP domain-containing protein n=1 Tax=Tremella mesenterica TaxID=5217 RepID=A0A4Q1BRY8_TREME|nr:hypothetical protein M231_02003 [Tremella mesenterica]